MERPLSRTPGELLRERNVLGGSNPAVVHPGGVTSYADLYMRAIAVSRALRRAGVGSGDRVGLLATNRIEWLESYFGACMAGATVHAFNSWATARELDHLVGEAACKVLVMLGRYGKRTYLDDMHDLAPDIWNHDPGAWRASRFPSLETVVVIGDAAPQGALEYEEWLRDADDLGSELEPDRLVSAVDHGIVLYTSGSTAQPKAVPLLGYAMVENGFHIGERMRLTADDRVWLSSPLFWSYGCANALMATFTHGATLVLQEQFRPAEAVDLIEAHECTAAYLLPTLTRAILGQDDLDVSRLSSLRTGLTIGTPDDVRLAAEVMGVDGICNVYGSTETYGNCCVTPRDADLADRLTGQGPPLPGVSLRVSDPATGSPVPVGDVGHIEVKGYLMPGYLGASARLASVFTEDGYYRTGDQGWLDERGWLHYSARTTDMIKTAGINVAPAEVEEFMVGLDGVADVAVVGVPHEDRGEVVVAYVVAVPGRTLEERELIAACRSSIASYKVPVRVLVVAELPKTSTGKLHRVRLKESGVALMHGTGSGDEAGQVPRTDAS